MGAGRAAGSGRGARVRRRCPRGTLRARELYRTGTRRSRAEPSRFGAFEPHVAAESPGPDEELRGGLGEVPGDAPHGRLTRSPRGRRAAAGPSRTATPRAARARSQDRVRRPELVTSAACARPSRPARVLQPEPRPVATCPWSGGWAGRVAPDDVAAGLSPGLDRLARVEPAQGAARLEQRRGDPSPAPRRDGQPGPGSGGDGVHERGWTRKGRPAVSTPSNQRRSGSGTRRPARASSPRTSRASSTWTVRGSGSSVAGSSVMARS